MKSPRAHLIAMIGLTLAGISGCAPMMQPEAPEAEPAAVKLGKMHSAIAEAVEEGMGYLVIRDITELQEFQENMITADKLALEFMNESEIAIAKDEALKEQFFSSMALKSRMSAQFNSLFAQAQAGKAIGKEQLGQLEASIDDFTELFGPFSRQYFDKVAADDKTTQNLKATMTLFRMHHDLLSGIEEAFGFLLLGDPGEADDFNEQMHDFQKQAAQFAQTDYFRTTATKDIQSQYRLMTEQATLLQEAASRLFDQYRNSGMADEAVIANFELAVDNLTKTYDQLFTGVLQQL